MYRHTEYELIKAPDTARKPNIYLVRDFYTEIGYKELQLIERLKNEDTECRTFSLRLTAMVFNARKNICYVCREIQCAPDLVDIIEGGIKANCGDFVYSDSHGWRRCDYKLFDAHEAISIYMYGGIEE